MDTKVIFSKKPPRERNGYQDDYGDHGYDGVYSDDDDVFVEDPMLDVSMATKPLMHPRQRARVKSRRPDCKCRLLFRPILYFLCMVISLGGLMLLILFLVNKYQHRHAFVKQKVIGGKGFENMDVIGCDDIEVEDVWVTGLPKLMTESSLRMVELNQDGVLDVVYGFGTGADGYGVPDLLCDIYFNGTYPCFGGVIALDGKTGKELWRRYTKHEVFALNCGADLDGDDINDCIGGGRAGVLCAVSGKNGDLLWNFGKHEARNRIMNVYTTQFVNDLDNDGVLDVLAAHGGDPLQEPGSDYRLTGRLIFFSGRTGEVLRWVGVPDKRETYSSPVIYTQRDGTKMVLFGTGGETHSGSLWLISLDHLFKGKVDRAVSLYTDPHKGVMTPPVLVDITGDGVVDIIASMFNSTTIAFDGHDYHQIWNYTIPQSETYCTPAPGYFNNDETLDFMIAFSEGPGFPVYYTAQTTVLDGMTGRPLLDAPVRNTVGAQASPITVRQQGRGNDIFLYWVSDCEAHEGEGGEYSFLKGTNVHEQSRSDFCKLRFKTNGFSKIYALNSRIAAPGKTLYYSGDRKKLEHSVWINTTQEALDYIKSHSDIDKKYSGNIAEVLGIKKPTPDSENKNSFNPASSSEFISPQAHYRNEQTSSRKKGPMLPPRQPMNKNRSSRPRGDVNYSYGGQGTQYRGQGQGQGQDGGYMSTGSRPDTGQYGQDLYPLPYGYQQQPQYPGYYGRDDEYEDNDDNNDKYYHDYNRYRSSRRTSEESEDMNTHKNNKKKFQFMRKKREADENSFVNFEKLKHLNELLQRETKRREAGFGRYDGIFMKRKKRDSEFLSKAQTRDKRHVGPHDGDGTQRLISTGTVAPTSLPPDHPDYNYTMDFIFATWWFYPAKTQAILPGDQKCIADKMAKEKERFDPKNVYYGLDHDNYERVVTEECLEQSDHQLDENGVYETQSAYNPFNVHMGQMTVYRVRIKCTCLNSTMTDPANKNKPCSKMMPFDEQKWPAYMGKYSDSHWR